MALALGLVSCAPVASNDSNSDGGNHVAEVVDLRNYVGNKVSFVDDPGNDGGRAARSARAASVNPNKEFSFELVNVVPRFIGENGVETNPPSFVVTGTDADPKNYTYADDEFAVFKNAVLIEDNDNGIKFTFTKPTGYSADFTGINVQFLDKVGHKSTGVSLYDSELAGKDTVNLVYLLVDPYSTDETRFWIQMYSDDYYADLTFKVVPVHGYGCVKSVQPDYKITDYLELSEDGVMKLKLTVPPVAKDGTLTHNVGLHAQLGSGAAYSEGAGQPKDIEVLSFSEPASVEEVNASKQGTVYEYTVDFKAKYDALDDTRKGEVDSILASKPYIWASVIYSYEVPVDGINTIEFDTPWVISNVVANPFASSAE
ncbi:MAG: hypothetical protein MJ176_00055 [Treponema sp.]|nr:hypothetical protein [Treponema sp.]